MIREIITHAFRFAAFLFLQGVLFNYMDIFNGLAYPMPYIFAMLMLPFNMPRIAVMVIGFLYGLMLDSFTDTLGLHTSACVFLGFASPFVNKIVPITENFGTVDRPTISSRGLKWYISFVVILTFLHHFWLFTAEWFKFNDLLWLFAKIILSTIYTVSIILLFQTILYIRGKSAK